MGFVFDKAVWNGPAVPGDPNMYLTVLFVTEEILPGTDHPFTVGTTVSDAVLDVDMAREGVDVSPGRPFEDMLIDFARIELAKLMNSVTTKAPPEVLGLVGAPMDPVDDEQQRPAIEEVTPDVLEEFEIPAYPKGKRPSKKERAKRFDVPADFVEAFIKKGLT